MTARGIHTGILLSFFLLGALLIQSCAAPLVALPVTTLISGAQLALKGGDIYKGMKQADGRKAFELSFEETWDHTMNALEDLAFDIEEFGKNEENDGGLVEAKSLSGKIRVAVIKLSEEVSEVGIWTRRDQALAELILARIKRESDRSKESERSAEEDACCCEPSDPNPSFSEFPLPPLAASI